MNNLTTLIANTDDPNVPQNLTALAKRFETGEARELAFDDPVPFACNTICPGVYCTEEHVDNILINPWDAWRMSKAGVAITPEMFEAFLGPSSNIPLLSIRWRDSGIYEVDTLSKSGAKRTITLGPYRFCPFHKLSPKGSCGIHAARPGVCRMYPLRRSFDYEPDQNASSPIKYFWNTPDCPVPCKPACMPSCKEHLDTNGVDSVEEKMSRIAMNTIAVLSMAANEAEIDFSDETQFVAGIQALYNIQTLRKDAMFDIAPNIADMRSNDDTVAFPAAMKAALRIFIGPSKT